MCVCVCTPREQLDLECAALVEVDPSLPRTRLLTLASSDTTFWYPHSRWMKRFWIRAVISQRSAEEREDRLVVGPAWNPSNASELGLGTAVSGGPRTYSLVFQSLGVTSLLANFLLLQVKPALINIPLHPRLGRCLTSSYTIFLDAGEWAAWMMLVS